MGGEPDCRQAGGMGSALGRGGYKTEVTSALEEGNGGRNWLQTNFNVDSYVPRWRGEGVDLSKVPVPWWLNRKHFQILFLQILLFIIIPRILPGSP